MENIFWLWLILGAVLILIEIIVPSFYALFIGVSALIVGTLVYFCPTSSFMLQGIVFITLSFVSLTLFIKFIRPRLKPALEGQLEGEVGVLVRKSGEHEGEIRFFTPVRGNDLWKVKSDEALDIDAYYKVVSVEEKTNILTVIRSN